MNARRRETDRHRDRCAEQQLLSQLDLALDRDGRLAREHLVHDDAHRPQIGLVGRGAEVHLGRHVQRRADTRGRHALGSDLACETQVADLEYDARIVLDHEEVLSHTSE